jgi:hypothetical protein
LSARSAVIAVTAASWFSASVSRLTGRPSTAALVARDVHRSLSVHAKQEGRPRKLRIVEQRPKPGKVDLMSAILIGTASWTDKTLIASGRFYPSRCNTPEERLRYYASQFPLVEIDSSYYAMRKPEVAELWAKRTPPDFTFNIWLCIG